MQKRLLRLDAVWHARIVGIGAALAVIFTVLVNLSLTPSLLLQFPEFFADRDSLGAPPWPSRLWGRVCGRDKGAVQETILNHGQGGDGSMLGNNDITQSNWFRFSENVVKVKKFHIIVAAVIVARQVQLLARWNAVTSDKLPKPHAAAGDAKAEKVPDEGADQRQPEP